MGSIGEPEKDWEVVVVGGGFCGCWALKNLRKEGFKVHMYEWGSALGGKFCFRFTTLDTGHVAHIKH